jgi:glycosyltransferase involved in cell wall biosynthesis
MKSTFIAWTRYDRRPELLARQLGATLHYVAWGRRGSPVWTAARYMIQAAQTWRILQHERPDVVFAQNPPIFCGLIAACYARCYRARYVIDSHSGAFLSPKWRWSAGLHQWLARGAVTTIVQNAPLAEVVRSWGCHVSLLGFTPGEFPKGELYPLSLRFNVVVISTYAEDEPLEVVFEAAGQLPDVTFYVTGDANKLSARLLAKKPRNCRLTGYLGDGHYIGLLRAADAVIDLTTHDNTLLMGAYEAVALGTPLITSDWPVLRDYFSRGAIHIANTVEGLCGGVRRAQHEHAALARDIVILREQLQNEWTHRFAELRHVLADG